MVAKPKRMEAVPDAPLASVDYSKYSFLIKTVQGATIKSLTETLKDIVHDVTLHLKPNVGVTCSCLEGTKTCIVYLILFADRLENFKCPAEERVSLSMDHLSQVTSMCGSSDQMTLYQLKNERNYIHVLIETQDASIKARFRLRLKAMDVFEVDLDSTEYLSIITMSSSFFSTLCRRCSKLADQLIIESLSDRLKISVEGMYADGAIEIDQTKDCAFRSKSDKPYRSKFALRFLLLFTKAASLSNTVELFLAQDHPLMLKYLISDIGELHLCQAAVVDEDEDPDEYVMRIDDD